MPYVFLLFLILISAAEAKKYALVVGGASKYFGTIGEFPSEHEFGHGVARNARGLQESGYEVTTLFDATGVNFSSTSSRSSQIPGMGRAGAVQEAMRPYHEYFGNTLNAQAASASNFTQALENLVAKAQAGDEIELSLFIHGHRYCDGKISDVAPDITSNNEANCEYRMGLINPETGRYDPIPADFLVQKLRELDAKGAHVNFGLHSCHSGALQEELKGMSNVCSVLATSGNNVAWGCFPTDPPEDLSYTSVGDQMFYRYYKDHVAKLKQEPFFQNDTCLDKISRHAENSGTQGPSLFETYWKSRLSDRMPEEPSISSVFNDPYFTEGRFSASLHSEQEMCFERISGGLTNLLSQVSDLQQVTYREGLGQIESLVRRYNQNIQRQKELKAAEDVEGLAPVQQEALELSQLIIQRERELVEAMRKNNHFVAPENDPCKRTFS